MYFTITTATTVGYGDLSAVNTPERMLAIVSMILGCAAFAYAVSTVQTIMLQSDSKDAKYK